MPGPDLGEIEPAVPALDPAATLGAANRLDGHAGVDPGQDRPVRDAVVRLQLLLREERDDAGRQQSAAAAGFLGMMGSSTVRLCQLKSQAWRSAAGC